MARVRPGIEGLFRAKCEEIASNKVKRSCYYVSVIVAGMMPVAGRFPASLDIRAS